MTVIEFSESLGKSTPPAGLTPLLESLWWDGKGDWRKSHEIAQDVENRQGNRIHAYLHRKEGDQGNASYWYHRAGTPFFNGSLQQEWEMLVWEHLKLRQVP